MMKLKIEVNCTFSFELLTQVLILIGKWFTLSLKTGYIPYLNFANGPLSCWISCQLLRLWLRPEHRWLFSSLLFCCAGWAASAQDYDLEKYIWIGCFGLCSGEHTKQRVQILSWISLWQLSAQFLSWVQTWRCIIEFGMVVFCFSAVQDHDLKKYIWIGCFGFAAGSTQNNGFKSFLKFLCGNYLPNSWVEFKLEGVPLSLAWFAGPQPGKIYLDLLLPYQFSNNG